MAKTKVAVTLERDTVEVLDRLVRDEVFPSRSRGVQAALDEKLARLAGTRLARECAKLDLEAEKRLAEEGLSGDGSGWPEY